MMRTNTIKWCVGLVLLLLSVSCGDADLFDTDKWSDKIEGLTPNLKIKVGHADAITLWDLINQGDSGVIVKEGNDLIIKYTKEDLYTIDVSEVFNMPAEDIDFNVSVAVPAEFEDLAGVELPEPINFTDEISNSLTHIPVGCELKKIVASATLNYELPDVGFGYSVEAKFLNVLRDGAPLVLNEKVLAGGPVIKHETLSNVEVNLAGASEVKLQVSVTIPRGEIIQIRDIDMLFALKNLKFEEAVGKIQVDPVAIEPGSFSMDVDFLDEIGGGFKFTKPELSVILRNQGLNIPLRVNPVFHAQNSNGVSKNLELLPGKALETTGMKSIDTLSLDNSNSNIVEFLSLPPQGDITYGGEVIVNPAAKDDNVVYSTAKVSLDAYVRIPLSLSADSLVYRDTINDIDVGEDVMNKIISGKLLINADNGIPLELTVPDLLLCNEDYTEKVSVKATANKNTIKGGGSSELEFVLTNATIKMLGRTKHIILKVQARTKDGQEVDVKADSALSFSLTLQAQADIKDFDF